MERGSKRTGFLRIKILPGLGEALPFRNPRGKWTRWAKGRRARGSIPGPAVISFEIEDGFVIKQGGPGRDDHRTE